MGGQSCNVDGAWTIGRLLTWTADYFNGQTIDESRLASEILLSLLLVCLLVLGVLRTSYVSTRYSFFVFPLSTDSGSPQPK